ncbi:MAG: AMP-binding protein [Ruminococcus sp.]|uniref:AMP-binding protein n=1 Tax=Ruminococcus sp. TaxID=41978 RepID=UPI0025F34E83|nr:AMP-binding protein [Ruminococcus sp.]MCR5540494.1 AMP-binding protein [Ruminococcus sp.]
MILYGREIRSLTQMLALRAENTPDNTAYIFISDDGEEQTYTFSELYQKSTRFAGMLRNNGIRRGDRCLLMYRQDLELLCGLFGCRMVGAVAVPLEMFRDDSDRERYIGVSESCRPSCILTNNSEAVRLKKISGAYFDNIPVYHMAQASDAEPFSAEPKDELAVLQYTSGSTGCPKGVMITEHSLLDNLGQIEEKLALNINSSWVGWLPYHHDMGLVMGLLTAVYSGCRNVFTSPELFKSNPETWIRAMSDYQATHTIAPNFAYELITKLLKEIDAKGNPGGISFASMEKLISGSEVVRFHTQVELMQICRKFGLREGVVRAGYGLAEATLVLTMNESNVPTGWIKADKKALSENIVKILDKGKFYGDLRLMSEDDNGTYLVGNGSGICGTNHVMILSPDGKELPPLTVGEICVTGDSVADGYWECPQATAENFITDAKGRVVLHTGDAGFMDENDEIYITGRYKESIVIHGVNYYPADIEAVSAKSHPALNYAGCAFSADTEQEDSIVILQEISDMDHSQNNLEEVTAQIFQNLYKTCRIQPEAVVLTAENTIPRTGSGKIRRKTAKELFLSGKLNGVLFEKKRFFTDFARAHITCLEDVRDLISGIIAKMLGTAEKKSVSDLPFMQMGISSEMNLRIVAQLNTIPEIQLAVTDIFNYPTVDRLAEYIYSTYYQKSLAEDLDSLSEEAIADLLTQELQ